MAAVHPELAAFDTTVMRPLPLTHKCEPGTDRLPFVMATLTLFEEDETRTIVLVPLEIAEVETARTKLVPYTAIVPVEVRTQATLWAGSFTMTTFPLLTPSAKVSPRLSKPKPRPPLSKLS